MEQQINIPTNRRKFFRQYVEILRPVCNIRGREGDVLAELLYQSYLRKDIGNLKDRFKLVFDYGTKVQIQEDIKISAAGLGNCITELRKKSIIGKDNVIHPKYLVNPDGENFSIKFNFVLKD